MSQHTPGPWQARPTNNNCIAISSKDGLICTITRNALQKQRAENAYLLAAGPDLLAALKKGLALAYCYLGVAPKSQHGQLALQIDAIEKALAKADPV
jgi:hypothetical protein